MAKKTITVGEDTDGKPRLMTVETELKLDDGRVVDFALAMPVTQGDWMELDKLGVVMLNDGERKPNLSNPKMALKFIGHFAKKANNTVAEIDLLPVPFTRMMKVAAFLRWAALEEDDDPS